MNMSVSHEERKWNRPMEFKVRYGLLDLLAGKVLECASCGKAQDEPDVWLYDHFGGETVTDELPKQWVSLRCACGYHTSYRKLKRAATKKTSRA